MRGPSWAGAARRRASTTSAGTPSEERPSPCRCTASRAAGAPSPARSSDWRDESGRSGAVRGGWSSSSRGRAPRAPCCPVQARIGRRIREPWVVLRERVRVGVVRLARLEPVLAELLRDRIEALPAERPIAVAHEQRIQARYDDADDREAERADIRCRQVAGDRLEPPPLELTRHRAKRLRRRLVPAVGQVVEGDRLRRGPAELGERLRTLRAVEAEMLHLIPHRGMAELDLDWELRRALHHLLGAPARSRELLEALDERPA